MEELDLEVASEFLLIAATLVELKSRRLLPAGRRRSTSTTSWRCGRSATSCSTASSSARRSRRPPSPCRCWPATPGAACGRTVGVDERYLGLMPDLLDGRHARRPAPRLPAGHRPQAAPARRPRPRGAHPGLGHRRHRRAGRRAAPGRAHHVPGAHRRPGRAARRSSCGSWRCSSCSSTAWSTSTSPARSATSRSCGSAATTAHATLG